MVELAVLGIALQEGGSVPVLLLHPKGTKSILSLRIGPMEAFAISTALQALEEAGSWLPPPPSSPDPGSAPSDHGPVFPRPLTHDLLLNCITTLNASLIAVEILDVVSGTFIAEAVLFSRGDSFRVDCRPSDGVALALRCGAKIFAGKAVLEHAEAVNRVLRTLPESIHAAVLDKLAELAGMPSVVRTAFAAKQERAQRKKQDGELQSPGRMLLEEQAEKNGANAAAMLDFIRRTMLFPEQQAKSAARSAEVFRKQGLADAPDLPGEAPQLPAKGPRIRVSLLRHTGKGEPELVDEFELNARTVSDDALANLGFSSRDFEAEGAEPDDERWFRLLRILTPGTKVLM